MLPLLRTILLLLWFRNFSEVYDFNLMTLTDMVHKSRLLYFPLQVLGLVQHLFRNYCIANQLRYNSFTK